MPSDAELDYAESVGYALADKIEILEVEEAQAEYGVLFFAVRALFTTSDDEDIARIVSVAVGVCPYCHANVRGCYCMRDD